jgi:hypothetical protein
MASPQIELPFTVWDILGAMIYQSVSLAGSAWAALTPGYRLLLIAVVTLAVMLPPAKGTAPARRFYRRRHHRLPWWE